MALYLTCRNSTHNIELIHGYLAILIVCYTMCYARLSYITMFMLTFSLNIGLICFRACSSSMRVHHHGGGFRGARVVILCTGVVVWARGSIEYDCIPRSVRVGGRW
jgi:hypothetical protein